MVHRCPGPGGLVRYWVCLHSRHLTLLIEHFDVHAGGYGSEADETRVSLSASGHACSLAHWIENLSVIAFSSFIDRKMSRVAERCRVLVRK